LSARRSLSLQTPMLVLAAALAAGCTPTVAVEAPKEPITINLNIKLDANVRLQVEEKAKQDVASKSIF
jgi:YnbE-like lipoprotein